MDEGRYTLLSSPILPLASSPILRYLRPDTPCKACANPSLSFSQLRLAKPVLCALCLSSHASRVTPILRCLWPATACKAPASRLLPAAYRLSPKAFFPAFGCGL